MAQPDKVNVILNLIDGSQRSFTFEPPPNQELRMAARFKEFMNRSSVVFQLPDRLLLIPMAQIKSIEFSPPFAQQIEGVFGHARELS